MLVAWCKRQWPQFSTRVGAALLGLSGASAYAGIDPRFGYVGAIAGVALAVWNQKGPPSA